MGLTMPAGRTDTEASGAGTEPAATAPTTPAAAGAATLAAALTSLLRKNCHWKSSLETVSFATTNPWWLTGD